MYGLKILCEISKGTFEISHKIFNPYIENMHLIVFYFCVWFMISSNCDVISLSQTGPWSAQPRIVRATGPSVELGFNFYTVLHVYSVLPDIDNPGKSEIFIIFLDNLTPHYDLTFSCHLSEINNICHRVTAWQSSTWASSIVVYRLKLRTRIIAEANKRCTVILRKLESFCIFGCPGLFHG